MPSKKRPAKSLTVYPPIREAVTPELLTRAGATALLHVPPLAKRETLSPKCPIVVMPDKAAMEAFLKQIGKEIGHAP